MNPIRYLSLAVVLVLGCQGMPTVTRTGDVKDIIIGDNLTSGEITVNPGDEVRWVNKRTAPVRVILIDPVSDKQLSCKNNFGGWMTPSDTAQLGNERNCQRLFPRSRHFPVYRQDGISQDDWRAQRFGSNQGWRAGRPGRWSNK